MEPVNSSGSLEQWVPSNDLDSGLDDMDQSDFRTPRLTIVQNEGMFKDSNTDETFPVIDAIFLGLIKQRVLFFWDANDKEVKKPLCRSNDHVTGHPLIEGQKETFPWEDSNFNKADFLPLLVNDPNKGLPCETCHWKDWNTNPRSKTPYCSELYTFPILYTSNVDDGEQPNLTALISFKRSALKNVKDFLMQFKRTRKAPFMVNTRVSLTVNRNGNVMYSTPVFKQGASTDPQMWEEYSTQYKSMRSFLHSSSAQNQFDAEAEGSEKSSVPASQPASAPTSSTVIDDDDLPF